MKKYGDVVTYVRNGAELKALVIQSNAAEDGEHLILSYLDPLAEAVLIRDLSKVQARTFAVAPYVDGASQGWKDILSVDELTAELSEVKGQLETVEADNATHQETIAKLVLAAQAPQVPSGENQTNFCSDCPNHEECKEGCKKKTEEPGK